MLSFIPKLQNFVTFGVKESLLCTHLICKKILIFNILAIKCKSVLKWGAEVFGEMSSAREILHIETTGLLPTVAGARASESSDSELIHAHYSATL